MYTQSFDKDYSEISTKLKQNLEILYKLRTEYINSPEIINIHTNTISADQDLSVKLELPYKTGDLGTDIMELLYVKKEGKLFSIKNYNVTYFLNENNIIHTIYPNMFLDDIEDFIENDVDCNYTILNNKYILEYHKQNFFSKKKIIFFSYVTLALDITNNNIKRIIYKNQDLIEIDIYDNIQKGKEYFNNNKIKIINIYKIEQIMHNKGYIAFLAEDYTNEDGNKSLVLLFFEIYCTNNDFYLILESILDLSDIINIHKANFNDNIGKIGFFENYKFILLINNDSYNDLIIIDNNSNNEIIPLENIFQEETILNSTEKFELKNENITDFLLYDKTLCLLTQNNGLIIYRINYDKNTKKIKINYNNNIEFLYGKKLEIYRNPFYGGIFLAILLHNEKKKGSVDEYKKGNEIYMEILLDDDNKSNKINISINKVITANSKRKFLYLHLFDKFFSYFYDDNNKELFIYRNGLLNIIPYVTYKINLTENKTNFELLKNESIINLIPLYNETNGSFNILFISNNSDFILKNLTLAKHNLNCTFHDTGSYNLTFILKGEACANSLKKAREKNYFSPCHKIIKYNFHVYQKDKEKKILFFISILFIVILLASIVFIWYTINTGCFGRFKNIKSYKINKFDNNDVILFSSRLKMKIHLQNINLKNKKIIKILYSFYLI